MPSDTWAVPATAPQKIPTISPKLILHFGLQLIFDESQKEGNGEIWVNCYELMKFLSINRSEAAKKEGTKEWERIYGMKDPAVAEAEHSRNP